MAYGVRGQLVVYVGLVASPHQRTARIRPAGSSVDLPVGRVLPVATNVECAKYVDISTSFSYERNHRRSRLAANARSIRSLTDSSSPSMQLA